MNKTLTFTGAALLALTLVACKPAADAPPAATAPSADTAPAPAASPVATVAPDRLSVQASDAGIAIQEGVGAVEGGVLTGTGKAGYLAFGPYAPLAAGDYRVTFTGTLPAGVPVRFDAVSARGAQIHGEQQITATADATGQIAQLDFSLPAAVADLEIRVLVPEGAKVTLQSYDVSKR